MSFSPCRILRCPLKCSPSDDDMEPIYLFALKYQTVSATVIEKLMKAGLKDFPSAGIFRPLTRPLWGITPLPAGSSCRRDIALAKNVLKELVISVHVEKTPLLVIISIEQWYPYTDAFATSTGQYRRNAEPSASFFPASSGMLYRKQNQLFRFGGMGSFRY